MDHTFTNTEFQSSIRKLRTLLPKLAFGLLISTYLISALIMGLFHAEQSEGTAFMVAAFAVPLVIQVGRGTLVFFFQLNPLRMRGKYHLGIIAATVLLVLSLTEATLVMWPHGLAWTISVATLMVIGWIIEVMILKEIEWSTEMAFFQNSQQVSQLKEYYRAKQEFDGFLQGLEQPLLDQHSPPILNGKVPGKQ